MLAFKERTATNRANLEPLRSVKPQGHLSVTIRTWLAIPSAPQGQPVSIPPSGRITVSIVRRTPPNGGRLKMDLTLCGIANTESARMDVRTVAPRFLIELQRQLVVRHLL